MASFEINDSDLTGFHGKVAIITGNDHSTQSDFRTTELTCYRWVFRYWSRNRRTAGVSGRTSSERRHSATTGVKQQLPLRTDRRQELV